MNRRHFKIVGILVAGFAVMAILAVNMPWKKSEAPQSPAVEERSDNGLEMKFCWCPAGEFKMGSPQSEKARYSNEDQVQVTLTQGFWLGKTEVTQGQWTQVMGTDPWKGEQYAMTGPDYAASYVSWDDATQFCRKLTTQERTAGRLSAGWSYALPTEAQWEYACRAGTTTRFSFGDEESQLGDYAWYGGFGDAGNSETERYAHGVGLKKPNAWGLHDMHGNVWEWCQDRYAPKLPGGRNPEVSTTGSDRVTRGASWFHSPWICRSAIRTRWPAGHRNFILGFRVARVPSSK